MIEIERTFLATSIPQDLNQYPSKEIIDVYIPKSDRHPVLRLRKNGTKFELTKKQPIDNDPSHQKEETIHLTEDEFLALSQIDGKKVHKIRYFYKVNEHTAEIDVFQADLKGLVVVDFEFTSLEQRDAFTPPSFCGADITKEEFVAGGIICGKTYKDIQSQLEKFNYQKIL